MGQNENYLNESNGMVSIQPIGKTQLIVGVGLVKLCEDFAECTMDPVRFLALIIGNNLIRKSVIISNDKVKALNVGCDFFGGHK